MLSKEKCTLAINEWEITRSNFSKIQNLIDPTAVFHFTQENCDWISKHNDNSKFHAYAGVTNDEFILIIIPLDKVGQEIILDEYLTTKLTDLKGDITLTEKEVVTTVTKTTLSAKLEITKHWKVVDLPVYNEPTISESASAKSIKKWKNECSDWFYYECNNSGGQNIFRVFEVPFADLSREDATQGEVIALFGFKYSTIYQTQIPLLVFVAIDDEDNSTAIIRSKSTSDNIVETNTKDWARPCPPLCKDKKEYTFL
jgi:hypothetical protein